MSQLKFEVKLDGEIVTATNDHDTMQLAWIRAFTEVIEGAKVDLDNKAIITRTIEAHMHNENRKLSVTLSTNKINPESE